MAAFHLRASTKDEGPSMATNSPKQASDWKKRESLSSALLQILVVGLFLAGAVGLVYYRGAAKKELSEALQAARAAALKGNASDLRKALSLTEAALEKDSSAPDALAFAAAISTDLWLIHRESGAESGAKSFLERAKKANAQTDERFGTEARHLVAQGQAKEANDFVEGLRMKGGSGARIFSAQALALQHLGLLKLARQSFRAASDKAWRDPALAVAYAESLLLEGAPGAVDAFSKTVGQHPEFFRARLGLALARVQKGERLGEALASVKEVLTRESEISAPEKARAIGIQGAVAVLERTPERALALADEASALDPLDPWPLQVKATALAQKKDVAAAMAAVEALLTKAPYAPVFYFDTASALERGGMHTEALAVLDKYEAFFGAVKNQTPDGKEERFLDRDDRYHLAKGQALKAAGRFDEALAAYEKAIEAKSINLSRATFAKGALLLERKQFDQALAVLQDVTPPDGSGHLPEAYLAMGELMFEKKEWGPGCQNYAFALAKMKTQQAPREKLNEVLAGVEKRLKDAKQRDIAKLWVSEAKPLIQ